MPRKRPVTPSTPSVQPEARPLPAGLEPRQLVALEALLRGSDMKGAATAAGVTLPLMFEWRYSLPFAEELSKRIADLRAYTHTRVVGRAEWYIQRMEEIAGDPTHRDQMKALAYLTDFAREQPSMYTSAAEWNAAREHARKSAYAELWVLPDAEIVATVRELKALPSGAK